MSHDDFAFEPVRGLPEELPAGENMLWQGAPSWWSLARSVFHIRFVALYFAAMIVWHITIAVYDQQSFAEMLAGTLWLAGLGALCCGILGLLAYAMARTTVYTITSERLVMRIGVALPVTLNIPFSKVETASCRADADGTGDIPVQLLKDERIGYAVLWPHARPLHINHPQPTLRGIPDVKNVAALLANALAVAASRPQKRQQEAVSSNVKSLRPGFASQDAAMADGGQAIARTA